MKLPNADRALVDRLKLTDDCLNPDHFRGRHKARVFEAALGLTAKDVDDLMRALLDAVQSNPAESGKEEEFGRRYVLEFEMVGPAASGRPPCVRRRIGDKHEAWLRRFRT